jgi:hypothetical protein
MLLNHSCVKQVQAKPVALQWIDQQEQSQKGILIYDVSDVCGSEGEEEEDNPSRQGSTSLFCSSSASYTSHDSDYAFTSTKLQLKKCPHCNFRNVHQESIDHHVKYGHKDIASQPAMSA